MTEEELLRELQKALSGTKDRDGFLTVREISKSIGRSPSWVRDKLRDMYDSDGIDVKMIEHVDIAGRVQRVPAYRIRSQPNSD